MQCCLSLNTSPEASIVQGIKTIHRDSVLITDDRLAGDSFKEIFIILVSFSEIFVWRLTLKIAPSFQSKSSWLGSRLWNLNLRYFLAASILLDIHKFFSSNHEFLYCSHCDGRCLISFEKIYWRYVEITYLKLIINIILRLQSAFISWSKFLPILVLLQPCPKK